MLIRRAEEKNNRIDAVGKGTRRMYAAMAAALSSMALVLSSGLHGSLECNGGVMAEVNAKDLRYGSFFVGTATIVFVAELSFVLLYTFVGLAKLSSLGRTTMKTEKGVVVVKHLDWWAVETAAHFILVVLACFSVLLFSLGINEGKKKERAMNVRGEPCTLQCPGFVAATVLAFGCLLPLCMMLRDAYAELVAMEIVSGCWGCRSSAQQLPRSRLYDDADVAAGDNMSTEMLKYAGDGDGDGDGDDEAGAGATPSPKKKAQPAGPSKAHGAHASSATSYKNDLFDAGNV